MITGFIPPTEGTVRVGNFDIVGQPIEAKKLIGYLPENAPAYTDMTVYGFLNFTACGRFASPIEFVVLIRRDAVLPQQGFEFVYVNLIVRDDLRRSLA
jgi:ABC-type multidrug transport system ATPase subunit